MTERPLTGKEALTARGRSTVFFDAGMDTSIVAGTSTNQMENNDNYCQDKVPKSLVKKKYECEYSHLQMENYDNCILWKLLNGITDNVITEVIGITLTN